MRLDYLLYLASLVVLVSSSATTAQDIDRPLLISARQFACLRAHADQLNIGSRGAIIDFSRCPPRVVNAFLPLPPSKTKRRFSPADIDCLIAARIPGSGVAFNRPGGGIAVYLNPCGKR